MKYLILALATLFFFSQSSAQSYYRAKVTEFYTYNESTEKYELYSKNSDANIIIVVENEFITIQAKSPTMYKVYSETKTELDFESMAGYRFTSRDLKQDQQVNIDLLKSKTSELAMLSIVNSTKGYNFRFYIVPVND